MLAIHRVRAKPARPTKAAIAIPVADVVAVEGGAEDVAAVGGEMKIADAMKIVNAASDPPMIAMQTKPNRLRLRLRLQNLLKTSMICSQDSVEATCQRNLPSQTRPAASLDLHGHRDSGASQPRRNHPANQQKNRNPAAAQVVAKVIEAVRDEAAVDHDEAEAIVQNVAAVAVAPTAAGREILNRQKLRTRLFAQKVKDRKRDEANLLALRRVMILHRASQTVRENASHGRVAPEPRMGQASQKDKEQNRHQRRASTNHQP